MSNDKSKLTLAQWAEAIGILIVTALVIVIPLSLLGALFHVRFIILGAPALALPIGLWIERQVAKWRGSKPDRM